MGLGPRFRVLDLVCVDWFVSKSYILLPEEAIWHSLDLSTHLAGVQVPCMFVATVGLTGLHVEPGTACPKSNLQALRVHSPGFGVYSGL